MTRRSHFLERALGPVDNIGALGLGWVGEEALAIGLYAALAARDFPEALALAANHDGDSDSTASIAGQIWGAWKGLDGIPHAVDHGAGRSRTAAHAAMENFRFTLFNGITLFIMAASAGVAALRIARRDRSKWPLAYYPVLLGYALGFKYSLNPWVVGGGRGAHADGAIRRAAEGRPHRGMRRAGLRLLARAGAAIALVTPASPPAARPPATRASRRRAR